MKMHVSAQSENLRVNRFSDNMSPGAQVLMGSQCIWVLSVKKKKQPGRRPGELVQQNAYQEAEDKYSCLDLFPIDFLNYIRKR